MREEKSSAADALDQAVNSFTDPRLKGKKLSSKPEWHVKPSFGEYEVLASTFSDQAIIFFVFGKVTTELGQIIGDLSMKIIKSSKSEKLPVIADIRGVTKISWSARKILRASFEQVKDKLGHFYYIISPNLIGYYKIYQTFYPARIKETSFIDSVEEGLLILLNKKNSSEDGRSSNAPKPDLELLSREELIALYKIRDEEYRSLKKRQSEFMEQVFHVISQITWDDDFEPEILTVEDKEFTALYSALNVLQEDVYEMFQQFKSLNIGLENKVALRTEELQNRNDQLENLNSEMDAFLHSTYHDLKRPLASVHTMIKLLREDYVDIGLDDSLRMVEGSVRKLEAFVREIESYAKNKSETIIVAKINLETVIEGIIQEQLILFEEKPQIMTLYDLGADFYSDSLRVKLIIMNIVSNALKFTQHPESHKVDIKVVVNLDHSEIKVKDSGVGIPPENYHKVFNLFFRSGDENAGSGLGLYIASQAAAKIGGEISFKSAASGTEFTIKVPNLRNT